MANSASPDVWQVVRLADTSEFDVWLEANHADIDGVWIQTAKDTVPRLDRRAEQADR